MYNKKRCMLFVLLILLFNAGCGKEEDANTESYGWSEVEKSTESELEATDTNVIDETLEKAQIPEIEGEEVSVEFKWDGNNWDGAISNLSLAIEGTLDDGNSISASEKDEIVYGSDGNPALQIETWEDDGSRSFKIIFHCTDGIYQITLDDQESMELYQDMAGISNADVQVTITDINDEIVQLEQTECLYRSYTGYWVLGICMDHGELGEYHADWMDVETPVNW